jgi:hypothetical protein
MSDNTTEIVVAQAQIVDALQDSLIIEHDMAASIHFTTQGLDLPSDLTLDQAKAVTQFIAASIIRNELEIGMLRLFLGCIINYSEARFGDTYSSWLDSTGLAYGTLANAAYVARKVDPSLWNEHFDYGHYAAIAPLPPDEQQQWLAVTQTEDLGANELRRRIQAKRDIDDGRDPVQADIERQLQRIAGKMIDTLACDAWPKTIMSGLVKPLCKGLQDVDAVLFAASMNDLAWGNMNGITDDTKGDEHE